MSHKYEFLHLSSLCSVLFSLEKEHKILFKTVNLDFLSFSYTHNTIMYISVNSTLFEIPYRLLGRFSKLLQIYFTDHRERKRSVKAYPDNSVRCTQRTTLYILFLWDICDIFKYKVSHETWQFVNSFKCLLP